MSGRGARRAPRVSCIVPAYNAGRFLAEALDSILGQTFTDREVVVVDDGSTDGTPGLAAVYGDRVRWVRTGHRGCTGARDAGLAVAHGEMIAFLDADDLWLPEKLEKQVRVFAERPSTDLCTTWFQNFWDPELAEEEARYRDHPLARPMAGYVVPTLLAPRSAFERFGGFSSGRLNSDTGWFASAIAAGARHEVLPEVLMRRRFHRANTSRSGAEGTLDGLFHLIRSRIGGSG